MKIPFSLPSSFSNVAYYGIGLFLMKGLSLIMLPFVAANLAIEQVGKLEFLGSIAAFLGLIINLSMHEALYRYSGVRKNPSSKKQVANQIYTLTTLMALTSFPVLILLSKHVLTHSIDFVSHQEFSILAFGLSIEGALGISLAWLRMKDRAKCFVAVTAGSALLQIILVIVAIRLEAGVSGILLSSVISHGIQLGILHRINYWSFVLPSRKQTRIFLRYCFPLALASTIGFALNGADRWILAYSGSLTDIAVYAIALKFSLAMCILVQPYGLWWMPKRFQHMESCGPKSTARLSQYGIVWIAMLTVSIAYLAPAFITLALPESYSESTKYVLGTLSIALMKELGEIVNIGILYKKKTNALLAINIIAAIVGISAAWLLKESGIWGVILALNIAQFLKLALIVTLSQRWYFIPYQIRAITMVFVFTAAFIFGSYTLNTLIIQCCLAIVAPLSLLVVANLTGMTPLLPILAQSNSKRLGRL
ncbi:lipopolysaccharide biosynthesis protein [Vibrio algarum]|uniref:Oligosaccharide flippase family protein n=1 Tax=Vibrio algarum TaxID=3020714 RepID=A0ABT4YVW4_9VIBR|nr:oligosaccharide flippase family protein [Vibrio sp. KJ40-1]MDB1125723.1 oligosaccharide flippase family protein [Vibrio sp. KJ40-1]